jgi:hypothetical protein
VPKTARRGEIAPTNNRFTTTTVLSLTGHDGRWTPVAVARGGRHHHDIAALLVAASWSPRTMVVGFAVIIVASSIIDGWLEDKLSLLIQNVVCWVSTSSASGPGYLRLDPLRVGHGRLNRRVARARKSRGTGAAKGTSIDRRRF